MEIIEIRHGDALYVKVLVLRQLILRQPLGMVYSPDDLERDKNMVYFAYIGDGEILGTVGLEKISPTKAQLRQMAVYDKTQGKGLGRRLVEALEDYSHRSGFKEIHLDARYGVRGFYARLGYAEYGDFYEKIGIRHINMKKVL